MLLQAFADQLPGLCARLETWRPFPDVDDRAAWRRVLEAPATRASAEAVFEHARERTGTP